MNVLVLDVGGNNVKMLVGGSEEVRKFPSGPALTPRELVAGVLDMVRDWKFDAISLGYPGPVLRGKAVAEPRNLGEGWVGFDFATAFGRPVKMINDAAMQALGSYEGGRMLFLGLGTGLGSALISDGHIEPMELGHLPYRKSTFEDHVGRRALKRLGKKKWQRHVERVVDRLTAAFLPDYVVLGGGNAKKLKVLPPLARLGNNANAFLGGHRLWDEAAGRGPDPAAPVARPERKAGKARRDGGDD
jgi:polyphosphate glucokinase